MSYPGSENWEENKEIHNKLVSGGVEWTEVESSNIDAIGYDADEEGDFYVRFNSGAEYVYHNVPPDVVQEFLEADSKGKYLNEHIKGVYQYEKV